MPIGSGQTAVLSLAAVYNFLPATGAQLVEGNIFFGYQAQLTNVVTDACMKTYDFSAQGQPYIANVEKYVNPPQGSPLVPGWQRPSFIPDLYSLPQLARRGGLLDGVETGSPDPPGNLPIALRRAIMADFQRCQGKASKLFAPLNRDGFALLTLWQHVVASVEASAPVQAAGAKFGTCLTASGAPAAAGASPDKFSGWLSQVINSGHHAPSPAAIRSQTAIDRHWTVVFARCAKPFESTYQSSLLQAQHGFFQTHYQQIRVLDGLAVRLVGAAKRASGSG